MGAVVPKERAHGWEGKEVAPMKSKEKEKTPSQEKSERKIAEPSIQRRNCWRRLCMPQREWRYSHLISFVF